MEKEKKEFKELQDGLSRLEKNLVGLERRLAELGTTPDATPVESAYREAILLHTKGELSQSELEQRRESYHRFNNELKDHRITVETIEGDIHQLNISLNRQRSAIRSQEEVLFRLVRDKILKSVDVKQIADIGLAYVAHRNSGGGGHIGDFFEDKFLKVSDINLIQKGAEIREKYFP